MKKNKIIYDFANYIYYLNYNSTHLNYIQMYNSTTSYMMNV